ncbi:hypothetical protein BGW41_007516 [Actinomortierella wolfii]|nr:hypothetical protein BGW41_007516 [Actinomortierella wolfii]
MEISPFPPSMPNLAKPTCPEYSVLSSQSTQQSELPAILLNEQSLDCLQQFYQQQDGYQQHHQQQQQQPTPAVSDLTDISSVSSPASSIYSVSPTLRSASPPPSPFSMASSAPTYDPILDSWMSPQQQPQQANNNNNYSLFGNSIPMEPYFAWNQQQQQPQQQHTTYQQQATATVPSLSSSLPKASSMYKASSAAPSHRRCSSLTNNNVTSQQEQLYRERRASSTSVCESASSSSSPRASISSISSISSIVSSVSPMSSPTSPRVKSYPCPTCGKPFPTRTQLKSHMAIHTDIFPFPCQHEGCDLHFKRKHDLRRHVDAKHALVKKYLCTAGCGEGFGRRDQMVRHLRRGTCQPRHNLHPQA